MNGASHERGIRDVAASHRNVVAVPDNIDDPIVEIDLDRQRRVASEQRGQRRKHVVMPEGGTRRNPHAPGRLGPPGGNRIDRGIQCFKCDARVAQKSLAFLGEFECAGRPVHQPHTQCLFEARHVLAHGSRRHAQLSGRCRKTSRIHSLDERNDGSNTLRRIHISSMTDIAPICRRAAGF